MMKKILVLGANGSLAKVTIPILLENPEVALTLFSRHPISMHYPKEDRIVSIQGDVMDLKALQSAIQGQDIIYANLAGNLEAMAKNIVKAMKMQGVKRIIWISSMGIYGETGEDHGAILFPYRASAKVIESSDLDYTIIRPAWFTDNAEIDYKLTRKGESFQGDKVSRRSIADLIYKLIQKPDYAIKESLGIAKV